MALYFKDKQELYDILGEKINFLHHHLLNADTIQDASEVKEIRDAITFLKDHKYQLLGQGLNQLEFVVREAETKLKSLKLL
jgi:hypothetical protein